MTLRQHAAQPTPCQCAAYGPHGLARCARGALRCCCDGILGVDLLHHGGAALVVGARLHPRLQLGACRAWSVSVPTQSHTALTQPSTMPSYRPRAPPIARAVKLLALHVIDACAPGVIATFRAATTAVGFWVDWTRRALIDAGVAAAATQTVRYYGSVPPLGDGSWVGVEFDGPTGNTNGHVGGKSYFDCPKNCGQFVKEDQLQVYSAEAKAATSIQAATRAKSTKDKVDRTATLAMYNVLDNHEEQMNLDRRSKLGRKLSLGGDVVPNSTIGDGEVDDITVDESYDGPHTTWPLTAEVMGEMLEAFKADKLMHSKYVLQILTKYHEHAKELPCVVRVHVDEGCRFTVVGDTHGQLADVLHIFEINGVPSPFNQYLFNGDFVDRGDYGVEIAMLIFGYKLLYPDAVHINRGNHECRSQTQVQGFMMEVLDKYNAGVVSGGKNRGNQIYDMFNKCFDALPLCTVLQEHVFVVHGGLFERRGIRLSHLEAVNVRSLVALRRVARGAYCRVCCGVCLT